MRAPCVGGGFGGERSVTALIDGASVLRVYSVSYGLPMLRTVDGSAVARKAEGIVLQGVVMQVVRPRRR